MVVAARPGIVVGAYDKSTASGSTANFKGAENYVWIMHSDGTYGKYGHFETHSLKVQIGQAVGVGQPLGTVGCTGFCTLPHLHFEVSAPLSKSDDKKHWAYQSFPTLFLINDKARFLQQGETLEGF